MPYSNLIVNPNAGSVPSLGNLDASQWSLGNAVQSSNNMQSGSGFGGMMSGLLSGGIGAVGSIFGSVLSNIFAKRAQERQFKYNKQLMDIQNQLQRDMLVDETALKLQGYKKAGLSTASLGGNFGGDVAVPSQSVSAPQGTAHDLKLGEIFNAARQVKLQEMAIQSQIDVNNAQADALSATARKESADASVTEHYGMPTASANLDVTRGKLREIDANIAYLDEKTQSEPIARESMWSNIDLNYAQILQFDRLYDIEYEKLGPLVKNYAANTYLAYMSGYNQRSQGDRSYALLPGDLKKQGKDLEMMDQALKNMSIEYKVSQQRIAYFAALKRKADVETDINKQILYERQFENEVRKSLGQDFFRSKARAELFGQQINNFNGIMKGIDTSVGSAGSALDIYHRYSGRGKIGFR